MKFQETALAVLMMSAIGCASATELCPGQSDHYSSIEEANKFVRIFSHKERAENIALITQKYCQKIGGQYSTKWSESDDLMTTICSKKDGKKEVVQITFSGDFAHYFSPGHCAHPVPMGSEADALLKKVEAEK
jgi:putative hemolysin